MTEAEYMKQHYAGREGYAKLVAEDNEAAMEPGRIEDIMVHGTTTGRWPAALKTHVSYPVKYLLVTGSLTTGFTFYGPFGTPHAASSWAEANIKAGEFCNVIDMKEVRT